MQYKTHQCRYFFNKAQQMQYLAHFPPQKTYNFRLCIFTYYCWHFMCCFEYFFHYRPCFTVVFSCCFYSAQKRVVEPQLWCGCFELTVEVLDTAVTQAPQLLFLFLSFFALSFFIDCEAPRGTVAEGGLRYATRPLHTICHGLNACLLPPSARACMCAHCLRLNWTRSMLKKL